MELHGVNLNSMIEMSINLRPSGKMGNYIVVKYFNYLHLGGFVEKRWIQEIRWGSFLHFRKLRSSPSDRGGLDAGQDC